MRAALGLLLLLLGLSGSGAQEEGGGLGEVGEINEFQKTAPRDAAEDPTERFWAEVKALRDMVVELKLHVEQLQRESSDLQTRLSESELLVSKSRIDQLERENAEKPKVAFYTGLTDAYLGSFSTDITLRFSRVYTNIGYAYDPYTGFFTAPVKGVYYVQFTVCSYNTGSMGVYVYKNNQRMMHNWEWKKESGLQHITNSVILELTAGDEIHLVLPSGSYLYDDPDNHSTFSGSLLFPL